MNESAPDSLQAYRSVNSSGTLNLARLAAEAGVDRFVFLSSIKVNGEHTISRPFTEADPVAPSDPYAVSKWEAEQALAEVAAATRLKVVTIRPPLVYGPWVGGNFLKLMHLVQRRLPLPFGSVVNLRSFIYVGNLVSVIERLMTADIPDVSTFLVSDDHDVSTPSLLRAMGGAMGIMPMLLPCPPSLLVAAARLVGRHDEVRRMIESLRADCSRVKSEIKWRPPFTFRDGITDTVAWFQRSRFTITSTTGK
jgi:UDP-glucose 4-epimerase